MKEKLEQSIESMIELREEALFPWRDEIDKVIEQMKEELKSLKQES